MVPKESGFNHQIQRPAYARADCDVFYARLPWQGMAKLYTTLEAAFLYLRRHNLPSKVRLRNNQTARNVYCGCNNNAIFSDRAIFTSPAVAVCQPRCWILPKCSLRSKHASCSLKAGAD